MINVKRGFGHQPLPIHATADGGNLAELAMPQTLNPKPSYPRNYVVCWVFSSRARSPPCTVGCEFGIIGLGPMRPVHPTICLGYLVRSCIYIQN